MELGEAQLDFELSHGVGVPPLVELQGRPSGAGGVTGSEDFGGKLRVQGDGDLLGVAGRACQSLD